MRAVRRHLFPAAAIASLAIAGALVTPGVASAHGLLISRRDLPIPEWLFAWAASLVLIVSFVALAMAWTEPKFSTDRWRPIWPRISGVLLSRVAQVLAGAIGVALLALVVWSGINGTEATDRNFSVTFVFVTFWLGMVVASIVFGDVFRAFNPWRAIAKPIARLFNLIAGQDAPAPLEYPSWLGRWPAAIGVLAFGWLELVYGTQGFQAVGLTPHTVGVAALAYSAITFVGMTLFGIDRWLDRGETFSVYMNMFSRLGVFEVREGRLGRRRALTGIRDWGAIPGSTAIILFTIGITAFDGASEGFWATPIADSIDWFGDRGLGPVASLRLSNSLFLGLTVGVICAIYWAGIAGMHTVRTSLSTRDLGRTFAHSFIPIALAYLVAHYFTLVFFAEQAQFGFLLSDPLGDGSNIFGTADNGIDYAAIGATAVWYIQVGALVTGHVVALVLGHDRALELYDEPKLAARSQYWMLALMVAFTSLGLFLLSQSNA